MGPSEKPSCYKNEDVYDDDDEECRECPWYNSCGTLVKSKMSAGARSYSNRSRNRTYRSTRERYSSATPPHRRSRLAEDGYIYEDAEEDDTFASVVIYNSALNGLQACTQTLNTAVSFIPRKSYEDVLNKRRKKK